MQKWLDKLSADDKAAAEAALLDTDTYTTYRLFNIFKAEGGKFGREGFNKFRKEFIAAREDKN